MAGDAVFKGSAGSRAQAAAPCSAVGVRHCLESQWLMTGSYFPHILGHFGVEWPVVLRGGVWHVI